MICQEVMELMQRYIDGDLDQQETSLMMDHVGQCPDCAAMLARLQKLSSELEQLPRVVPRMSLVDAILPELERIDLASSTSSSPSRDEDIKEKETPSVSRSSRPNRHFVRNITGVVAAGVVAGLLLFGQPDKWFLPGGSSHEDSAAQSPASAASEDKSLKLEKSLTVTPTADLKDSPEVSDQYGETGPLAGDSQRQGIMEAPKSDRSKVMGFDTDAGSESADGNGGSPLMSINAIPAERSDSPDGKWSAIAVEDAGTYQVYKTEDNSEWFTSETIDGKISLLSWNEESTVLYFTVTDSDGKQTQWQFDTVTVKQSLR